VHGPRKCPGPSTEREKHTEGEKGKRRASASCVLGSSSIMKEILLSIPAARPACGMPPAEDARLLFDLLCVRY
jgi:hypothetical protein